MRWIYFLGIALFFTSCAGDQEVKLRTLVKNKHNLPEIIREIRAKLKESEDELKDLGPPMPSS